MVAATAVATFVTPSADAVVLGGGAAGGFVVGALLSDLPVGGWHRDGAHGWENAVGYGTTAAAAGTVVYFALVAAYNLAATWYVRGVFAPQVVLAVSFGLLVFHLVFSLAAGFVGGYLGLVVGNLLTRGGRAVRSGRRDAP